MKTRFLLSIISLFILSSANLFSQPIQLMEGDVSIDGKARKAVVAIINFGEDDIKKEYDSYIKVKSKSSSSSITDGFIFKEVELPEIISKRGDVSVKIEKLQDGTTKISTSFALGYDIYLNSAKYPEEYKNFENFVFEFLKKQYTVTYEKTLKKNMQEKEEMEREKKKILSKMDKYNRNIKRYESKISSLEKDITNYKSEIKENTDETAKISKEVEPLETKIKAKDKMIAELKSFMDKYRPATIEGVKK